ncbi:MAG: ComF family protein [Calothrix sp. C42_A2020_038]|nr:ComF family protein [Calothrix sp. C42_A2020_038]
MCPNCTRQLQKCQLNNSCVLWKQPIPVFAWGAYGGMLKRSIALMKYEKHPEVARLLGTWLGQEWLVSAPPQVQQLKLLVVPIPLHPQKLKQRGFNQAALIGKSFCYVTGFTLKQNGLKRVQNTQALYALSSNERKKNLAGAFMLGKDLHQINQLNNTKVLIIDDIYTTGTTVTEAVMTLSQAGVEVIGVAVTATSLRYG